MTSGTEDVAAAAEFIDRTLQNEGTWYRADDVGTRLGGVLASYGCSVGAVRGTVRDGLRKFKDLDHDAVVMLASALWSQPRPGAQPVFERRLAAVVLLQSRAGMLRHSDLTRIEGFLRSAQTPELADPLVSDVVAPLLAGLPGRDRRRADVVLARWAGDADGRLRQAAARLEQEQDPGAVHSGAATRRRQP
ncbi:DNA alkylation repair protein [Pseudarthrobacter sp. NamE2]|uniref:DNA alkylation repair protein n=1 Tax=Pseudarthrobacter sp. NamE2 TaxID=2576838 RepID=UPI0010FE62F8|nr:DNA alkylation repair protein [Pseudarthrobacter sp. NamE2]TLM86313.1 DNA alkylation repair protein [Pseudarthrobacter sp. NamE2]